MTRSSSRSTPLPGREQALTALWSLLVLGALVVVLLGLTREPLWPEPAGMRWVAVDGMVTESRVVETRHGTDVEYTPRVTYRYHDGAEWLTSSNLGPEIPTFDDAAAAQRWLDDYPVGSKVTVHFRETLSSLPVLDRGFTRRWVVFLGALTVLAVGSIGLRVQWHRNAYFYLHGKPRPRLRVRLRRPIRRARKGEVYRRDDGRPSLEEARRRVPNYREFY